MGPSVAAHRSARARDQVALVRDRSSPEGGIVQGLDGRLTSVSEDQLSHVRRSQSAAARPAPFDEEQQATRAQQSQPTARAPRSDPGMAQRTCLVTTTSKLCGAHGGAAASPTTNSAGTPAAAAFVRAASTMRGERSIPDTRCRA